MIKLILSTCLFIALMCTVRAVVAAPSGYGINSNSELHSIDLGTGATTFIGSFSPTQLQGIAMDPNGNLFGTDSNGNIYGIDTTTGVATFIGSTGLLGNISGLDFNGTTLLASDFNATPTIYSIDTTTAISTPIITATTITDAVRAMTMLNSNEILLTTKTLLTGDLLPSSTLQKIDITTGTVTLIGILGDFSSSFFAMDFADDGQLYVLGKDSATPPGKGTIFTIDPTDGAILAMQTINLDPGANQMSPTWLGLAAAAKKKDTEDTADDADTTIEIALDIKPKRCPNKLYVKKRWGKKWKKKGILKAAILGTETFNVRDVDIETIRLNGVAPGKYRYKDLTSPTALQPCDCEALDADSFEDLVLRFKKAEIVDRLEDVHDGDKILLTLTGKLIDEVTTIEGSDCILIVDKGDYHHKDDGRRHKKRWAKRWRKKCKKKRHYSDDDSNSGSD